MKTIELNVGEIMSARMILNEVKGGLLEIRKAYKALDKIELTDEEQKNVGLKDVGMGRVVWEDESFVKSVELSDEQVGLLKQQLQGKKDFSTVGAQYALSLAEKIDPEMFKEE